MRKRTAKDNKISKKKHFDAGNMVKIRIFEHVNHETGEKEQKTVFYLILEKIHKYDGTYGTYYKVWDVGQGKEMNEVYLHDIPEDQAEVILVEDKYESQTT